MRRLQKVCAAVMLAAAFLLLGACGSTASESVFYARFRPDESRVISLSAISLYGKVDEIYYSVYDYVESGSKLIAFDTSGRTEAKENIAYYLDLYASYLEVNDLNIEMTDMNLDYSRSKYNELKALYGAHPKDSQRMELNLLLKQIDMYEKSQEENKKSREINEKALNDYKAMEENSSLSDVYTAPQDGFLLSYSFDKNEETGSFQVGTMIAAEDVLLDVKLCGAVETELGQELQVNISGRWVPMRVCGTGDTVSLRLTHPEDREVIDFLNPLLVQVSTAQEAPPQDEASE